MAKWAERMRKCKRVCICCHSKNINPLSKSFTVLLCYGIEWEFIAACSIWICPEWRMSYAVLGTALILHEPFHRSNIWVKSLHGALKILLEIRYEKYFILNMSMGHAITTTKMHIYICFRKSMAWFLHNDNILNIFLGIVYFLMQTTSQHRPIAEAGL